MRRKLSRWFVSLLAVASFFAVLPLSASASHGLHGHHGGFYPVVVANYYGQPVYASNHGGYFWVDEYGQRRFIPPQVVHGYRPYAPYYYDYDYDYDYDGHGPGLFGLLFGY